MSEQSKEQIEKTQIEKQSQRAYSALAHLIGNTQSIEEMVALVTNMQMMFAGSMAFAVDNQKMTTERAKALYLLRSMYTNAKAVLEDMSEQELKAVSMREQFMRSDN